MSKWAHIENIAIIAGIVVGFLLTHSVWFFLLLLAINAPKDSKDV